MTEQEIEKKVNEIIAWVEERVSLESYTKELIRLQFIHRIKQLTLTDVGIALADEEYEPYFGWCDVDGCKNEGCSGGSAWRDTGYWTVCYKHSDEHRKGLEQPKMKQSSVERENKRDKKNRVFKPMNANYYYNKLKCTKL